MRRVKMFIILTLILIFDFCISFFIKKPKKTAKKIAFVKTDAIGDAIIWLPSAIKMRKHFENKGNEVHLFCSSNMVNFFVKHGGFKNVHGITRKEFYSLRGRVKILKEVRKNYFSAIYNVHFSRFIAKDDFIVKYSVAEQKIGYLGNLDNTYLKLLFNYSKKYYSTIIPNPDFESEILINANFVRQIGIDFKTGLPTLSLNTKKQNIDFIAVVPGASAVCKSWQPEYFAKVIEWIVANTKMEVRVFGDKKEIRLFDEISKYYTNLKVKNFIGKTTLDELFEQLCNAKIVISNDTGAAHISGALGVPTIVILGGAHSNRFFPHENELNETSQIICVSKKMSCFGCAWKCTRQLKDKRWECVANIFPEDIINVLKDKMKSYCDVKILKEIK